MGIHCTKRRGKMTEKESQAKKLANKFMWGSAGAGLIPMPLVDIAAI